MGKANAAELPEILLAFTTTSAKAFVQEGIVLMDYGGNVEAKWICYGDGLMLAAGD
jgi:hypothetical protein